MKVKQKMLKEDLEFFKAQRRLLETMLPKNKPSSPMTHGRSVCLSDEVPLENKFNLITVPNSPNIMVSDEILMTEQKF